MGIFSSQPQMPIGERVNVEQQQQIPLMQLQSQELGKDMIDAEKLNFKAYLSLLGKMEVDGTIIQFDEPYMNETGAARIYTILTTLNNKGTYLTKIEDNDVIRITRDLWLILLRTLIKNRTTWGLTSDISSWSTIRKIITDPIYFALRRGENAAEKKFFADTHQSKSVISQENTSKFNKGFFG